MEAAFEVFGQQGYRQTTMRLICAQARLADRYFSEHFASTHDCYVAVHQRACEEAAQVVEQAIRSLPGDLLLRARGGLTAFFEHVRANPLRARILILDSSASGLSAQNRVDQQYAFLIDLLKARFRQRYPKAHNKPKLEYVVSGCIGMINHTVMLWIERQFCDPIETVVDHSFYAWIGLDTWLSKLDSEAP
ncbi:MAG: TetR/AcrR family transcriptional regulator [Burkholderiales bacterium]|nr:TetR/AcrR family transcriptional regulator [Burkholderiales bacterium]